LKGNSVLTTLGLARNKLGAVGAQAIAGAVNGNHTLTKLDLSQNSIGAAGAQAFVQTLKVNSTLTTFYLYDNNISKAGAQAIVEVLESSNFTLFEGGVGDVGPLLERNKLVVRNRKQRCRQIAVLLIGLKLFNRVACLRSNAKDIISLIARLVWHTKARAVWDEPRNN